jgi:hypothetical protein
MGRALVEANHTTIAKLPCKGDLGLILWVPLVINEVNFNKNAHERLFENSLKVINPFAYQIRVKNRNLTPINPQN